MNSVGYFHIIFVHCSVISMNGPRVFVHGSNQNTKSICIPEYYDCYSFGLYSTVVVHLCALLAHLLNNINGLDGACRFIAFVLLVFDC